jgi:hypothetical protein
MEMALLRRVNVRGITAPIGRTFVTFIPKRSRTTHTLSFRTPFWVAQEKVGYYHSMREPWTLDRLIRQHWSITNRSGHAARGVTFVASGALVVFGQRDWTIDIAQLEAGQGYPISAKSAWGSTFNAPEIRVTWFSDLQPEHMRMTTLHWPASAISFPGAPLQNPARTVT